MGRLRDRLVDLVGGRERAKVVGLLACVFALDGANMGAIGSMTIPLGQTLHVTRTEVGLLLTASLGTGVIATLPFGVLVDYINRVRLLKWMVALWGVTTIASGLAPSYMYLLVVQVILGGATACVAPSIASLTGDYFFPEERGRVYSFILSGELVGTGLALFMVGELASWSWRAGLFSLGPPALLLTWALHRHLAEPIRGGASRLRPAQARDEDRGRTMRELVAERSIAPRESQLFGGDPRERSVWWGIKYVLKIRTNLVLIIGSALGYFYLSGIRTFGVAYFRVRYGLTHATSIGVLLAVGVTSVVGVLVSGRIADALLQRGNLRARIWVATVSFAVAVSLLLPAYLIPTLWLAIPFYCGAAAGIGAINPPLDSARLDIMAPPLWGRAEATRMICRKAAEALAPLAFGAISEHVFGPRRGLHLTFLMMLSVLVLGGSVAVISLRTYPRDVATAEENARRFRARENEPLRREVH